MSAPLMAGEVPKRDTTTLDERKARFPLPFSYALGSLSSALAFR